MSSMGTHLITVQVLADSIEQCLPCERKHDKTLTNINVTYGLMINSINTIFDHPLYTRIIMMKEQFL
jgi:hypothetical protein